MVMQEVHSQPYCHQEDRVFSLDPSVDSNDGLSVESITCDACDISDYLLCSVADGIWRYLCQKFYKAVQAKSSNRLKFVGGEEGGHMSTATQ